MTLVKFNNRPANGFSLLDNFFNEMPTLFRDDFSSITKDSVPVNVKETKDAYQLEVVAPGFERDDFKLSLDKNLLTISGERKSESKDENDRQVRKEYTFRGFKRSFTIDEKIDVEKIDAKYVNGVLTLNLPRKAEVKAATKEITVQ
jgi:HSP20 family protein